MVSKQVRMNSILLIFFVVWANFGIAQSRYFAHSIDPIECFNSQMNSNRILLGENDMNLVALTESIEERNGAYFLIRLGKSNCDHNLLQKSALLLSRLIDSRQFEALSYLSNSDLAGELILFAAHVSVGQIRAGVASWSGISVRHISTEGGDYFVGFFPTIFFDGQLVQFIVDYYDCPMSMTSYRGSNSCKAHALCCKEWYEPTVGFIFKPKVFQLYKHINLSFGFWITSNSTKTWIPFTSPPAITGKDANRSRKRIRSVHIVGDSVYGHLFQELNVLPGSNFRKFSYSNNSFIKAECHLETQKYINEDLHLLSNIARNAPVVDAIIFSYGSHSPFITTEELGYYVDLTVNIIKTYRNVTFLVNGISDSPTIYMKEIFKQTQLCTRNSYSIAQMNSYLERRFKNLPNALFFDPFPLTFSASTFGHYPGDPVHFAGNIVYRAWSSILSSIFDEIES